MRDRERRIKGMCAAWIVGTIVGVIVLMIILAYTEKAQAAVDISAKYKTTTSLTMRKSPSGKKVKTLKKGTTVRVYEQRGNWLKVKHKSSTGWVLFKNSTGQQNLKRTVDGWIKCGEYYYYKHTKLKKTFKSKYMQKSNRNIYGIESDSDLMICVDKQEYKTYTFYRVNGRWIPHGDYTTNIGMTDWETPCGVHTVFKKLDKFTKNGLIFPYAMKFWGGCFVHSQGCWIGQPDNPVSDTIVGMKCTHGCVSMKNSEAKWSYKRCEVGKTKVVVFDRELEKYKNW